MPEDKEPPPHHVVKHARTMSIRGEIVCICCESLYATQEDLLCDVCRKHADVDFYRDQVNDPN